MRVLMVYLPALPCPRPQEDGYSPRVETHHLKGLQGSRTDCLGQDSPSGKIGLEGKTVGPTLCGVVAGGRGQVLGSTDLGPSSELGPISAYTWVN